MVPEDPGVSWRSRRFSLALEVLVFLEGPGWSKRPWRSWMVLEALQILKVPVGHGKSCRSWRVLQRFWRSVRHISYSSAANKWAGGDMSQTGVV